MTVTVSDQTVLSLNNKYRFQWEEAQGCNVLLYPEGLVKLSDTAAEIIKRCLDPISFAQLLDTLCQAFPQADRAVIEGDLSEFVSDALAQNWLVSRV